MLASFNVLQAESVHRRQLSSTSSIRRRIKDRLGSTCIILRNDRPATNFRWSFFTHGGGWTAGSKAIGDRGVRFAGCQRAHSPGVLCGSIDYRLCSQEGQVTIRDCITDSKDALRFLAKNAKQFSVDAERVFTFGDSAGGHLAQMLLLSAPETFVGDPALADAKYRLIAGVSWYGPCDFEKTDLFKAPGSTNIQDRFAQRIARTFVDERTKLAAYREVSPVNYLDSQSPPLLMVQGTKIRLYL